MSTASRIARSAATAALERILSVRSAAYPVAAGLIGVTHRGRRLGAGAGLRSPFADVLPEVSRHRAGRRREARTDPTVSGQRRTIDAAEFLGGAAEDAGRLGRVQRDVTFGHEQLPSVAWEEFGITAVAGLGPIALPYQPFRTVLTVFYG